MTRSGGHARMTQAGPSEPRTYGVNQERAGRTIFKVNLLSRNGISTLVVITTKLKRSVAPVPLYVRSF